MNNRQYHYLFKPGHLTPASSNRLQLRALNPYLEQLSKFGSCPLHPRLLSAMMPLPGPKCAEEKNWVSVQENR